MKRKATMTGAESATAQSPERPSPRTSNESARLTARLRAEEKAALVAFAKTRHWTPTAALRAILREKLLGEKIPF